MTESTVTSGRVLRDTIAATAIQVPGAPDALVGKLIEEMGFAAIYVSGAALSAGVLAMPDIGLFTLTELAQHVEQLTARVTIPVIVDADTGFGDTASVEHAEGTYALAVPDLEAGRASAALDATATRLDAGGTLLDAVAIDARYADRQVDFDGEVVRDTLRLGAGGGVRLEADRQLVSLRQLDASGDGLSWTLAPDAAPRAVTLSPAEIFGVSDRLGSLEVGKMANLVVTDGDLLEARTTTRYLFIDGRNVPLATKHSELYDTFKDRSQAANPKT